MPGSTIVRVPVVVAVAEGASGVSTVVGVADGVDGPGVSSGDDVADGTGAVVTYEAELTLNGVLRFADPLLGLAFGRIGGRAADGLIDALDGERVETPT